MNSILELENYCIIKNPVGALLITGEWGCGKTYIVENELKERLKESHVIIRISLFGISSVEELHKKVKDAWIHSKGGFLDKAAGLEKFKPVIDKFLNWIPNDTAKNIIGNAFSINVLDLVKVDNVIDNKRVVIVFDDIERSTLSIDENLGAINEYCENQHFNVILIADESRLRDESYRNLKEKVVQRTVHYAPNYESVVEDVIKNVENSEYKDFLLRSSKEIVALFAGTDLTGNSLNKLSEEKLNTFVPMNDKDTEKEREHKLELIKKRPHNIRSLKAAIQDFERIFRIIFSKNIEDGHKWLFSFLSFSMAVKANLIQKSEKFGLIFGNQDMEILYPGFFDSRFLPHALYDWIFEGSYDEGALIAYIDDYYKVSNALTPKELVKNSRIDYLDEKDAIQGMRDILQDAYNGDLELNEYVLFIINSKLTREYGLLELKVEWTRINEGIKRRIEKNIEKRERIEQNITSIGELEDYSEEEITAYSIIKEAGDSALVTFEVNRRDYIQEMRNSPFDAFVHVSGKRYNYFDEDMAYATLDAFKTVDNPMKARFPGYFEGVWINYCKSFDVGKERAEKSREGFNKLKEGLEDLCETSYSDQPFKLKFTKVFISVIEELLANEEKSLEKNDGY